MELSARRPMRISNVVDKAAAGRAKTPKVRVQRAMTIACTVASLAMSACVDISGGAVELSWSFQTFQGDFIQGNCTAARVDQVRLSWQAAPDSGLSSSGVTTFPCDAFRGITDFVIEAGDQLLEIAPICQSGMAAPKRSYEVPAPIRRTVREREVVTLDSLLIVIDDASTPDCACCDSAPEPGQANARAGDGDRFVDRQGRASR